MNLPAYSQDSDGRAANGAQHAAAPLLGVTQPGTRLEICRLLDPDVFHDPLRRVVFEEIPRWELLNRAAAGALSRAITNRGFPEFDLHEFLAPHEVNETEIDKLFEGALHLLDQSHPDEEQLAN